MPSPHRKTLVAACLLGTVLGGRCLAQPGAPASQTAAPVSVSGKTQDGAAPPVSEAAAQVTTAVEASAPGEASAPLARSLDLIPLPSGEHAPLALFSLGSLAVGGLFYGIGNSIRSANAGYTIGDRSQITSVVGVAGLTALCAAGAYFYYAHQSAHAADAEKATDWDAVMTGGVAPDGDVSIGARVSLPLPSLSR